MTFFLCFRKEQEAIGQQKKEKEAAATATTATETTTTYTPDYAAGLVTPVLAVRFIFLSF